jgi:hypothetical protein
MWPPIYARFPPELHPDTLELALVLLLGREIMLDAAMPFLNSFPLLSNGNAVLHLMPLQTIDIVPGEEARPSPR